MSSRRRLDERFKDKQSALRYLAKLTLRKYGASQRSLSALPRWIHIIHKGNNSHGLSKFRERMAEQGGGGILLTLLAQLIIFFVSTESDCQQEGWHGIIFPRGKSGITFCYCL